MATMRSMRLSIALYTTPMPPLPRTSMTSYLPILVTVFCDITVTLLCDLQQLPAGQNHGADGHRRLTPNLDECSVAAAYVLEKVIFAALIDLGLGARHEAIAW